MTVPATIKVLIAEDHGVVRDGTRRILEEHDDLLIVAEVDNGKDAVAEAQRTAPDVALVDIHLPEMNGIDVTRALCDFETPIHVLILSAFDDDDYVFTLMEAGAMGYLLKTARAEEVVDAVRAVARGEVVLHPAIERKIARIWARRRSASAHGTQVESFDALTPREQAVLRLVANGLRNKEIAETLHVSTRTIEGHLNNIYAKINVTSRTEAVIYGANRQWFRINKRGEEL